MWSLMKRLIWLHVISGGGGGGTVTTATGTSPLTLANALAKSIRSLVQYGKVTTSGGDTYCNNGKLVAVDDELPSGYERQIGFEFSASTYYPISDFHLRGSDTVRLSFSVDKACNVFGCYTTNSATDNYSLYASTSSGGKYLRYDGTTYNSYIPSAQIGERIDVVITPNGTSGMPTDSVITPAEFEATADLCIGTTSTSASSSKLDGNIWGSFVVDGRLTLIPCKRLSDDALGYYDLDSDTFYEPVGSAPTSLGVDSSHLIALSVVGTHEVLTISEQTATVENLLAVDDIADEHNIISGAVTRRCEAVISDGTTPSGRYIGEVGDGNIIVKVRETGYEGDVATFEADRAKPLNGLTVNVEPIQAGSGDPSPDNVRPISGRTSATVTRCGKNLLSRANEDLPKTASGVTFSRSGSDYIVSATDDKDGYPYAKIGELNGLKAGNYTLSYSAGVIGVTLRIIDRTVSPAQTIATATTSSSYVRAFTLSESNTHTLSVEIAATGSAIAVGNYTIHPMLELGSTASAYEPYQGNTYTIALGDTVYGGTLDVTQGKMVVDRAMKVFSGSSSEGWFKSDYGYFCTGKISGAVDRLAARSDFQSNLYAYGVIANNSSTLGGCLIWGAVRVRLADMSISLDDWEAQLASTPMQVVYTLATPLEITLTPTQIETLIGTNNIWSDAGSVKAYVADEKTEHVAPQPLRTAEGNNTVAVTSAVAPVQLSATYTASE